MYEYIIILIIVIVLIFVFSRNTLEGFHTYYGYYKQYCSDCEGKNPASAMRCTNCGICETIDGTKYSTSGDSNGPYFARDCNKWIYGNSYFYYPFSNIYPITQVKTNLPKPYIPIRNRYRWINRYPNN